MTAGRAVRPGGESFIRRFGRNLATGFACAARRPPRGAWRPARPARSHLVWGAVISIGAVVLVMLLLDAPSLGSVRELPPRLIEAARIVTDFGLSGWFLYPLGTALLALAALAAFDAPRFVRDALAALSIRLGFLFAAIAVPGLAVAIVKRLIGRARPFVEGQDPFAYQWPVWRSDYASLPSGHSTSAFAAAVAIGAVWPRARPFMWAYAVLIALSRVAVTAHHPSDVVAGAIFGTVGALLVRNWFAHRRLGFVVTREGAIRALRWPSWGRLKAVARRLVSAKSPAR